jgi:hypothetical protein
MDDEWCHGFDLGKGGPATAYALDDLGCRFVPDEGPGVVVPVLRPRLDGVDQLPHTGEDPRRRRRSVISLNHRSTRFSHEPALGLGSRV